MKFLKKYKSKIVAVFYSLLTYFSVIKYISADFFNVIVFLLYFPILGFYLKFENVNDKKVLKYSNVLALLFSLCMSVGKIVSANISIKDIGYLNLINFCKILFYFVGLYPLFKRLFIKMFINSERINILNKNQGNMSIKVFFICFIFIFICWLVLFLRYYPSIMTPDSYYVVHYANENILNDHHAFGHTQFFSLFYHIGKTIFSSITGGVAFYIIIQMLLADLIFMFALKYFYSKSINKYIIYLFVVFIGVNPLFSHYSITLWRDIPFSMCFIPIVIMLYEYVNNNFKITIRNVIVFTLFIIMMLFMRNNGIYVFIVMIPFIILIGKKNRIKKVIYCILIVSLYLVVKGPIFNQLGVTRGLASESLSVPIQQISRVVASNKKIDSDDYKFLSKFYDVEKAKTEYNPVLSDKMKGSIDNSVWKNDKIKFLSIWSKYLFKYPNIYFEAYFTQTLGYWYPDVEVWSTGGEGASFFEKEYHTQPIINNGTVKKIINLSKSKGIPFVEIIWSIGMNIFIAILSLFLLTYKFGKKYILPYTPLIGLWMTMMIASPVYAEVRYVYAFFALMPFMLLFPFVNKKGSVA